MSNRVMTNKVRRHLTCLLIILSVSTCYAEPEPLPGMIYAENFADDTEGFVRNLKNYNAIFNVHILIEINK